MGVGIGILQWAKGDTGFVLPADDREQTGPITAEMFS